MTKIQVTDGKKPAAKKPAAKKSAAKKPTKKIAVKKAAPKKKITVEKVEKPVAKKAPAKKSVPIKHISVNAAPSAATHSTVQKSTTLSRKYVKRPAAKTEIPKPVAKEAPKTITVKEVPKEAPKEAPVKEPAVSEKKIQLSLPKAEPKPEPKAEPKPEPKVEPKPEPKAAPKAIASVKSIIKPSMPKLKAPAKKSSDTDKALKSALRSVATMNEPKTEEMPKKFKKKHRGRRVVLALFCSAVTVAGLVAFVHFNMPDISVRVAALQTGIEATYPTFVPRNYSLSNVSSDRDGEVIMTFTGEGENSFTLSEEASTWDSTALLNNYVKKTYPADYTTMREQGITIYTRGDQASWVNGGILYKIQSSGKNLTKEQIRNIATSL